MLHAAKGHQAKIHYTIRSADGKTVGSSKGGLPLTFVIGDGKVLRNLDQGVLGMQVGQRKTIEIKPQDAYGLRNEDLVIQVGRDELPTDINLQVGRAIQYQSQDGERVNLMVQEIGAQMVVLDGNHPLAGQSLSFDVELVALS